MDGIRPAVHVSELPRLQAADALPLRVAQARPTTTQPSAPEVTHPFSMYSGAGQMLPT